MQFLCIKHEQAGGGVYVPRLGKIVRQHILLKQDNTHIRRILDDDVRKQNNDQQYKNDQEETMIAKKQGSSIEEDDQKEMPITNKR